MSKEKNRLPLGNPEDSLNNVVSSCEMTGLEPVPPKNKNEEESYGALNHSLCKAKKA